MKTLIFSEYKQKIVDALKQKGPQLGINEPVTVIDGFVNQPIQHELSGSFIIGGPSIPMVMVVGNNSGRIYYFALKALIQDIEI